MSSDVPQAYADAADLARLGVRGAALVGTDPTAINTALMAQSVVAAGSFRGRFPLPLTKWGDDTRLAVCQMAAWTAMTVKGFRPESDHDQAVRLSYEDAQAWLKAVREGKIIPAEMASLSTPDNPSPRPQSHSIPRVDNRGWKRR